MTIGQQNILSAYTKGYRVIGDSVFYKKRKVNTYIGHKGYPEFSFRNNEGISRSMRVHRLVAYQKYGQLMFKKGIEVRHLDGNNKNFLAENISIGTHTENMQDKPKELRIRCALIATSHMKIHDHKAIVELHNRGLSYKKIMQITGISSKGTLSFIIKQSIASKE